MTTCPMCGKERRSLYKDWPACDACVFAFLMMHGKQGDPKKCWLCQSGQYLKADLTCGECE